MIRYTPYQLATVCVPWNEAGEFLEPVFRRQVRLLRDAGLGNLYIFGTAGEGYAVTDPVFKAIATVFFDAGQRGDVATLRRLTGELNRLRAKVIAVVARERGHMDGAYDKLYARLADPEFPLGLLSPYQGASPAAFDDFRQWLTQEAPRWVARENDDETE